ncbi:MAG: YceD family protein [Xanthobacteraceae bacterium]|jgi:uncharacterized metal-binding protein YceD (DUF177 family)
MREQRSEKYAPTPWQVPVAVEDVAETGARFDLVANAQVRAAVARMASLRDLPRLEANFDVTRRGAGLHVAGRVSATVGQLCIFTLEPLVNEVEEAIDLLFMPQPTAEREDGEVGTRGESADETEPLIGGLVDLGALAIEFLILGLDPYPRKPGAVFQPPEAKPYESPFAALASLRKGPDDH